jgi:hypothetical protein
LEKRAAEYSARSQEIVSYSHVVRGKKKSSFRLRGGKPDSAPAKALEKNFGMYFDEQGKLRNFKYTTEERYNQVGNLATMILHNILKTRYNFGPIQIPETPVNVRTHVLNTLTDQSTYFHYIITANPLHRFGHLPVTPRLRFCV